MIISNSICSNAHDHKMNPEIIRSFWFFKIGRICTILRSFTIFSALDFYLMGLSFQHLISGQVTSQPKYVNSYIT